VFGGVNEVEDWFRSIFFGPTTFILCSALIDFKGIDFDVGSLGGGSILRWSSCSGIRVPQTAIGGFGGGAVVGKPPISLDDCGRVPFAVGLTGPLPFVFMIGGRTGFEQGSLEVANEDFPWYTCTLAGSCLVSVAIPALTDTEGWSEANASRAIFSRAFLSSNSFQSSSS
jgi:hypothetical protein